MAFGLAQIQCRASVILVDLFANRQKEGRMTMDKGALMMLAAVTFIFIVGMISGHLETRKRSDKSSE